MSEYTYTLLKTIPDSNGNNVIWHPHHLKKYFYQVTAETFLNLTQEEKDEWFEISWKYADLLDLLYEMPKLNSGCAPQAVQEVRRTPIEEWEHINSIEPDADMTEYEWNLKLQILKEKKEWFEKYHSQ
jgi:hypothetical protein